MIPPAEEFIGKMAMVTNTCYGFSGRSRPTIHLEVMQLFLCVGVVYGLNNKANDLQLLHEEKIISVHSGNLVGFKNTEALVGYRFCLTGNHRRWPRNVLIKMIQCLGGEVVTSPRQANRILRADDVERTIKLRIAAERGIKVVTVSELFHSLGDSILFGLHYC